ARQNRPGPPCHGHDRIPGERGWLKLCPSTWRAKGGLRMAERQRACVIGAGVSGLTAAKSLGDWGVSYTCFDASDDVGGNWYFRNPNGRLSAYRPLHIDTSKNAISFADFPMDGRYPDFPHHTEIHQFLREYADRFGLRKRIRFETLVERADRLDGGGWLIRT